MRCFGMIAVALLAGAGCGGGDRGDGGDGDGADVADGATSSDAEQASADLVPAVGTEETIDVGCWNLEEFPLAEETPDVVSDLVASLALDVVAVEEIQSQAALDQALARLPGWEGVLPAGDDQATGGLGVLWRSSVLTASEIELLFEDDARFIRPVVQARFTASDDPSREIELLVVHLKAGIDESDEMARVAASVALEQEVRAQVDGDAADRILVLGDFNEDSSDPLAADVFEPWLDAPERYGVLSRSLDEGGAVSFLPAGIMLDQMVATSALAADVDADTPLIPPLDDQLASYQDLVSDHLPLIVRLAR